MADRGAGAVGGQPNLDRFGDPGAGFGSGAQPNTLDGLLYCHSLVRDVSARGDLWRMPQAMTAHEPKSAMWCFDAGFR